LKNNLPVPLNRGYIFNFNYLDVSDVSIVNENNSVIKSGKRYIYILQKGKFILAHTNLFIFDYFNISDENGEPSISSNIYYFIFFITLLKINVQFYLLQTTHNGGGMKRYAPFFIHLVSKFFLQIYYFQESVYLESTNYDP